MAQVTPLLTGDRLSETQALALMAILMRENTFRQMIFKADTTETNVEERFAAALDTQIGEPGLGKRILKGNGDDAVQKLHIHVPRFLKASVAKKDAVENTMTALLGDDYSVCDIDQHELKQLLREAF